MLIKIKPEDAVVPGRGQIQRSIPGGNFVAVFEEGAAPRINQLEIGCIREEFVAGRYVNPVTVERDTSQTTIGTTPLPVNVSSIPVDGLFDSLVFEVEQINTTMAFTLATAADDRACDEPDYLLPNPLRTVNQIVRGRSCARMRLKRGSLNNAALSASPVQT